jgi:hypothetical protein
MGGGEEEKLETKIADNMQEVTGKYRQGRCKGGISVARGKQ